MATVKPVDPEKVVSTIDEVLAHPWNVMAAAYIVDDGVARPVETFYEWFDHKDAAAEWLVTAIDWVKDDVKTAKETKVGTALYSWIIARVQTGDTYEASKVDRLVSYEFPAELQRQIKARPLPWLFPVADEAPAQRRVRRGVSNRTTKAPEPKAAKARANAKAKIAAKPAASRGVKAGTGPVVKSGGLAAARAKARKAKAS